MLLGLTSQKQAVIARLNERVFDLASETLPQIGEKRQDRGDEQKTGYA